MEDSQTCCRDARPCVSTDVSHDRASYPCTPPLSNCKQGATSLATPCLCHEVMYFELD